MSISTPTPASRVECRPPSPADAAAAHAFITTCPPLESNSVYAYLLVCSHFAGTSAIARRDGHLVGFLSAYLKPAHPDELFVWQVAVSPATRGQGVAQQMLRDVLSREVCRDVRFLEATVTADNQPSRRFFHSFATTCGAAAVESLAFSEADFGPADHPAEQLVRIGPMGTSIHTTP